MLADTAPLSQSYSRSLLANQSHRYKSSAVAEMGDRLATIDMGRKWGEGLCPLFGGAPSSCNTMSPEPRPTFVPSGIFNHLAVWGVKAGCAPFFGRGAGSPPNTKSPGPKPTYLLSGILIHPTVWSQYTKITDRQDRTTDR